MRPNDEAGKRAARADAGAELGKTLAEARAARGVTVEEIAAELRIEPRLLHALEQCRFEELGPPVFAKGYLKQYGNRLGLKYSDLLAEYYRLVEPKEVTLAPSRTIKLRDERQITIWIIAALALALLAVFLMVWWLGDPPGVRNPSPAVSDAEPEAAQPAVVESSAPPPIPAEIETAPESGDGADAADASGTDEVDLGAADAAAATAPAPSTDALVAAEDSLTGPTMTIEFAFIEDCWLEATDARGARLFYGLGQAGALRRVTGEPPIDVILGNADGVALTVDGEPYVVPNRNRQGNLARLAITGSSD